MFNRRLLADVGGDTSNSGNYRLLVGNFYDPSAGTLCRGYYTQATERMEILTLIVIPAIL